MKKIPPFPASSLERISRVLGDTENGITGSEIGNTLKQCRIPDTDPTFTKWQRLFNALVHYQNKSTSGNHVVGFIHKSIDPVLYTNIPEKFRWFRDELNPVLSFSGLGINENGKVTWAKKAKNLDEALARKNRIQTELERRSAHPEVLNYCTEELMRGSSFHAVFEAMKGISSRMRSLSNLTSDGANLVEEMFALGKEKNPIFAINDLSDESQESEQKGFVNLVIGMHGMFRNTTAHKPRKAWKIEDIDAIDILTAISLVHRKLDQAKPYR